MAKSKKYPKDLDRQRILRKAQLEARDRLIPFVEWEAAVDRVLIEWGEPPRTPRAVLGILAKKGKQKCQ